MDEDPAWLEVISSFDAYGSTEELLDALLNEPQTESGCQRISGSSARVGSPREFVRHAKSSSSSVASSDSETMSVTAPPKKRKRLNKSRPKHEIERLQQSVRELEAMLELLHQRQGIGRKYLLQNGEPVSATTGYGVWKGVASRQFRYLRESQLENDRLKSQVQAQLSLIKHLARLVQRAQVGAPTMTVHPTLVPPAGSTMIAMRRQRMFATTDAMYKRLNQVLTHEKLSSPREDGDFRESEVRRFSKNVIPAATTLVHTWAGLLVPLPVADVAGIVWTTDANKSLDEEVYRTEYEEVSPDSVFNVHSLQFPMPRGMARFHGVYLRRRFVNGNRSVVVAVGSIRSLTGTPAPMNAVDFETKAWTVVQSDSWDSEKPSELTRLLANLESGRFEDSSLPVAMNSEEAAVLYSFMENGHKFLLDHLQRAIDTRLLSTINNI